jgi:hypothetical protein
VLYGLGDVATGPYPKESWAYDPSVAATPYDPEAAKALLVDAGWSDHDGDGWLDRDGQPFRFTLLTNQGPVTWKPLTKDGAPVRPGRSQPVGARQLIGAGETYDFEFEAPPGRHNLWLEVRNPGGKWQAQGHVIVK